MVEFITVTAPAQWASYFINDDPSGLEDKEGAQADAWLASQRVRIVDVARDAETGEAQEPRFTNWVTLYAPQVDYRGGDVLDYVAESLD